MKKYALPGFITLLLLLSSFPSIASTPTDIIVTGSVFSWREGSAYYFTDRPPQYIEDAAPVVHGERAMSQASTVTTQPPTSSRTSPLHAKTTTAASDGRGCCSSRGGVCGCAGTKLRCCDETTSPTCPCDTPTASLNSGQYPQDVYQNMVDRIDIGKRSAKDTEQILKNYRIKKSGTQ